MQGSPPLSTHRVHPLPHFNDPRQDGKPAPKGTPPVQVDVLFTSGTAAAAVVGQLADYNFLNVALSSKLADQTSMNATAYPTTTFNKKTKTFKSDWTGGPGGSPEFSVIGGAKVNATLTGTLTKSGAGVPLAGSETWMVVFYSFAQTFTATLADAKELA
jgi:hypothetical protein